MATWRIEGNAITMFVEAKTGGRALLEYVREAGYRSIREAAEACGQSEGKFLGDIRVTQVRS